MCNYGGLHTDRSMEGIAVTSGPESVVPSALNWGFMFRRRILLSAIAG
jgi:hypothetical protein